MKINPIVKNIILNWLCEPESLIGIRLHHDDLEKQVILMIKYINKNGYKITKKRRKPERK